jgi:hypothetical protein
MNRRMITGLACGLLFAAALHAAGPTPAPPTDAEPAVQTSPAAAPAPRPASSAGNEASQSVPAGSEAARPAAPSTGARSSADRIELEATQITGNAELPRVMYVVPWKRPELGELGGRPAKSLLDEVLEPVDRDVFRRQNRYYEALRPDGTRNQQ